MLTAEKIEAKTPEERLELLDSFARLSFGDMPQGQMAERMGYTRRSWANWRSKPETIPAVVLLLLQEWALHGSRDAMALRTFSEITDSLEGIAKSMAGLATVWTAQDDA